MMLVSEVALYRTGAITTTHGLVAPRIADSFHPEACFTHENCVLAFIPRNRNGPSHRALRTAAGTPRQAAT